MAAFVVAAGALVAVGGAAFAQAVGAAPSTGSSDYLAANEFETVLERLDALTIGLIVAAVVFLGLLVWRIRVAIRRERPVVVERRADRRADRRAAGADDSLLRPTLQGATDWGFDQNKRAALARSPAAVAGAAPDLPSIEHAITQWSASDVLRANAVDVPTPDSLGASPGITASPYRTGANPYFRREQPLPKMEVEEVADTLLQAELLVQLGDPKQAMALLSHHIRETEKPGAAVWLMLLDLYQTTGREKQYNALAAGFKALFNAEVPAWAVSPDKVARDLESYPQVLARLQAGWSAPGIRAEIDGLLNDDRGGSRQGFSLTAYRELLFLAEILEAGETLAAEEAERAMVRRKLAGL